MKNNLFANWLTVALMFVLQGIQAQVGVNILTPHNSAAFQVVSPAGIFKGLLTPSMTTVNRNSILGSSGGIADGLIVFDSDHHMHYQYNIQLNKWQSLSPFLLTTSVNSSPSFPAGTITTPSSTATFSVGINKQNPSQALDVVGNASISGSLNVAGFPSNALVPAGTIVMYNGSTAPAGWAICDGGSGTPDLRGRFIVASGQSSVTTVPGDLNPNYTAHTKGGENTHVLTKAELARHAHEMNADGSTVNANGGGHTHNFNIGVGTYAGGSSPAYTSGTAVNTSSNTHSHPTSDFSGKTGNGATDGLNGQAHENRPQFYVLTFIMKL